MPNEAKNKWSQEVTDNSDAMDLKRDMFRSNDPREIAHSLKISAEKSARRKSSPFQSAMSMLTFYINRAGKNLPDRQKRVLQAAKVELRKEFNRDNDYIGLKQRFRNRFTCDTPSKGGT